MIHQIIHGELIRCSVEFIAQSGDSSVNYQVAAAGDEDFKNVSTMSVMDGE
jgi:hypothetical protein